MTQKELQKLFDRYNRKYWRAQLPRYTVVITKDPSTDHTVALTGAGSFDPSTRTVVASGSFTIFSSSGSPLSFGTWKATGFDSFCPRGGPNSGSQGGVLVTTVTLFPKGGEPTSVTMTVNCLVFAPPNNAGTCSPVGEGVTITGAVGDFTTIVRGATLFHLNQRPLLKSLAGVTCKINARRLINRDITR